MADTTLANRMLAAGGRESANVQDRRQEGLPMSPDERRAALAASFVDSALLGYGDYALSGAMSLLPGRGNWHDELMKAKFLEYKLKNQDPISNTIVRTAGAIGPGGIYGLSRAASRAAGSAIPGAYIAYNALGDQIRDYLPDWTKSPPPSAQTAMSQMRDTQPMAMASAPMTGAPFLAALRDSQPR